MNSIDDAEEYATLRDDPYPLNQNQNQNQNRNQDQDHEESNEHVHIHVHLASLAEKKRLWWKNAVINTCFISSWWVYYIYLIRVIACSLFTRFVFATILSVYNKWMFSTDYYGFPYPLFVTTLHMFVQFSLSAGVRAMWPRQFKPDRSPSKGDYG